VLGCLLLALMLLAATWAWLRWRGSTVSRGDLRLFGAMAVLAVGLHLGMDALNSYGVHPFWPLDNQWYFGDSVFILEPLYWLAVAPLYFAFRSRLARLHVGAVLVIASGVLWFAHSSWLPAWAAPLPAVMLVLVGWRGGPVTRALASVALVATVTLAFVGSGMLAQQQVQAIAAREFPQARTLDVVLSPAPANPFCWDLLLVQRMQGELLIRQGQLSLLQSLDPRTCPATQLGSARTAPLRQMLASSDQRVRWLGEFAMPRATLAGLIARDCRAREMMQFLRAPFVVKRSDGWIMGDLRFDREAEAGFAEQLLPPQGGSACSHHVPWIAPRADLL
jgi:inner membrane protein